MPLNYYVLAGHLESLSYGFPSQIRFSIDSRIDCWHIVLKSSSLKAEMSILADAGRPDLVFQNKFDA